MHHNTLFRDRNLKKFSGEGHSPSPLEREKPLPRPNPFGAPHRALGFMRPVFSVPIVGNPTPIGERKYCIKHVSLFICLCVCIVLAAIISLELHVWSSPNFLCMLPMAVAQSSSGSVLIRCVLPVLWMTSHLLTSQGCLTLPPSWCSAHAALGLVVNCVQSYQL